MIVLDTPYSGLNFSLRWGTTELTGLTKVWGAAQMNAVCLCSESWETQARMEAKAP